MIFMLIFYSIRDFLMANNGKKHSSQTRARLLSHGEDTIHMQQKCAGILVILVLVRAAFC